MILPVEIDRLKIRGSHQFDTSTLLEQLIIPLQIESTKERNSHNLQEDLNTMIKYKGFTKISMYNHTSFLDQDYGYKLRGKLIIALN